MTIFYRADNFYAFLLHWKPEIYGDDEETEARKMGFVIFDASNNQSEEDLDILDEYFGHRESISKDWEVSPMSRKNCPHADIGHSIILISILGSLTKASIFFKQSLIFSLENS